MAGRIRKARSRFSATVKIAAVGVSLVGLPVDFWKSRKTGRPRITTEIRALIRKMKRANPLWGAPRIHGELLKLGIEVSERTVLRWLPHLRKPPSQS